MKTQATPERTLPHSLEAERALLGAVLLEGTLFDQAAELINEEDFYAESHQKIFQAMARLASESRAIDPVTLAEELTKSGDLETVGGIGELSELMDGTPHVASVAEYAGIIKERSLRRRLIRISNDILSRSFSEEESANDLLETAEKAVFDIGQERIASGFRPIEQLVDETYAHIQRLYERKEMITGIGTGFIDLDNMMSGLQDSDMIVLAARPGLGKTSLALNVSQYAAIKEEKTVGIFSLEMSANQLVTRLVCAEARVDSHRVRSGYLSKDDWSQLAKAMARLSQADIFIDDTPGASIVEMRAKTRRLKARHGLDLLIIDYMQLMSGGPSRRQENRQQEISAISRGIKLMAKELAIPVVALSQLSRAPEQRRGDHKPQLSDLRESGSIEQDADVVLFIYRPDRYKKDEDEFSEEDGVAHIIIGKQRNGPTGTVKLAFIEQWTKFENLARESDDAFMG
ncbi:MAG TPA: replicative DNA helicase [Acidobacteriota bacterium]|nr:replicative DNA helicase [Acidobacteriota bacterium]